MIAEIKDILGMPPRDFGFLASVWYLNIVPPTALRKRNDDLLIIYKNLKKLFEEGEIALAVLVQANVKLFDKGGENHPANVIYSTDSNIEDKLPLMFSIAERIFSLKNQDCDEEEQYFSDLVTDEYKRAMKVPVPKRFTDGLSVFFTTIMVHREHLPNKRLSKGFFHYLFILILRLLRLFQADIGLRIFYLFGVNNFRSMLQK